MTNYNTSVSSSGAGVALAIVLNPYSMLPTVHEIPKPIQQAHSSANQIIGGPSPSASIHSLNFELDGPADLSANRRKISGFYKELLDNQLPLGGDFEKILDENLWDLYER